MALGAEWQAAQPMEAGSLGQAACARPEGHVEMNVWIWDSVGAGGLGRRLVKGQGPFRGQAVNVPSGGASPPSWLPGLHT